VLFMVLPWGVRPQGDGPPGTVASAPARPRLPLKFAVTTAIALVLTGVVQLVVAAGWVTFRPPPG
jgi:predicted secreted protein